jgi:hypothetical protein
MITDKQIRDKWREVCESRPKGCTIDSGAMVIEVVRWAVKLTKPVLEMDLPEVCDCGQPFPKSGHCPYCGANARY